MDKLLRDCLCFVFTQRELQVAELKSLKDARKKHAHLDLHFIYQVCFREKKNLSVHIKVVDYLSHQK